MRFFLWPLLIFFCGVRFAWAGNFYSDLMLLGQGRENQNNQNEMPLNNYLGFGGSVGNHNLSTAANMRWFRDIQREFDDYDLYQAVVTAQPSDAVDCSLGRLFISEGFSTELIDGLRMVLEPEDFWFKTTLYSGIPRNDEIGDFNENDGLLTGLVLSLNNIAPLSASVQTSWRKNDVGLRNLRENDAIRFGTNLSYSFGKESPHFVYGLWEYDATAQLTETGTLGIDLNPSRRISFNLEGNFFNIDHQNTRRTVLRLFTEGPTFSGRFASTWTLLPKYLDFIQSYSFQRIEIQDRVSRNAHLASLALVFSLPSIGLQLEPGYDFKESFGGRLHGTRLLAHQDFLKRFFVDAGVDFAAYEKITRDNDRAFSAAIWSGCEITDSWTISAGLEYNRNNVFLEDIRGSFRLEFHHAQEG